MNPLSKEVRDKIGELVGHCLTSVSEMRRHLQVFVDTMLFKEMKRPALSDAAYYPTDDTIKTHIYLSQLRLRYLIYILSFLSNYFIQQIPPFCTESRLYEVASDEFLQYFHIVYNCFL